MAKKFWKCTNRECVQHREPSPVPFNDEEGSYEYDAGDREPCLECEIGEVVVVLLASG